ncbi:MAG: EAL domain-containing protein, partial [Gammaproteobacteria bacterium]
EDASDLPTGPNRLGLAPVGDAGTDLFPRFCRLLDAIEGAYCIVHDGRLRYLDALAASLLGIAPGEDPSGRPLTEYVLEDDATLLGEWLAAASATKPEIHCRVPTGDDDMRRIRLTLIDPDKTAVFAPGLCLALAEAPTNDTFLDQVRLKASVFDNSLEGVIICDDDLRMLMVNPAFTAITGYREHEVLGEKPSILSSGRHGPHFYRQMWEILETSGHWEGEIWNRRKSGEIYPEYLSITALHDAEGIPKHYIGVFTDISHRKLTDDQIHRLVHYDTLTNLPNRELFRQQLRNRIVRAGRRRSKFAVIFIDVDRFKSINDTLGHREGDKVLQMMAHRLENSLRNRDGARPHDIVARLSGDEFAVIVDDLRSRDDVALVAEKILEKIKEPISLGEYTLRVEASAGITIYPDDADNVDDLLRNSDLAMYNAKQQGRGRYRCFSPMLRTQAREHLQMLDALHQALDEQQFELVYQPQVASANGLIRGVEALLRWQHPKFGKVPPSQFIPLLEQEGQIQRVGLWVLERSCRQAMEWKAFSSLPIRLAVNLSLSQIRSPDFADEVRGVLAQSGMPPACLEVELTESVAMDDVKLTQRVLGRLKEMGVRISIDDFGTGYSSLSYLQYLNVDALKIDRSFIDRCLENRSDELIVRSIVALAHSIDLEVVAEGVETQAQREFLGGLGVELLQGYLFSEPVSADEITRMLEAQSEQALPLRSAPRSQ